jgi:DNA-binding XRE family transcriptional regulator
MHPGCVAGSCVGGGEVKNMSVFSTDNPKKPDAITLCEKCFACFRTGPEVCPYCSDPQPSINNLKAARLRLGLTLRAAAKAANVSNPAICQVESGHIKTPSVPLLFALSKCYHVPMKKVLLWVFPELKGEI